MHFFFVFPYDVKRIWWHERRSWLSAFLLLSGRPMFKYMWKTLNLNFRRSIITLTLPFKWDFIKHLPLKCRRNSETGSETCYYSHKELEIEHASKRLVDNFRSTEKVSWYQHSVLGSVYRFLFFFLLRLWKIRCGTCCMKQTRLPRRTRRRVKCMMPWQRRLGMRGIPSSLC